MVGLYHSFFIPVCTQDLEVRFPLAHEAQDILELYQDQDLAKEMPFLYELPEAQKLVDEATTSKLLFIMDRRVTPQKILGLVHWNDSKKDPELSLKLNAAGKKIFLETIDVLLHILFMVGGNLKVIINLQAQAFLERRLLYYRGFRPENFQNSSQVIAYSISQKAYYTSTLLPSKERPIIQALCAFLRPGQLLLGLQNPDNPRDSWNAPLFMLDDESSFELTLIAGIQKNLNFSVHPLSLEDQLFVTSPQTLQLIYTCRTWEDLESPQPTGYHWVDLSACTHRPIPLQQSVAFYRLIQLLNAQNPS